MGKDNMSLMNVEAYAMDGGGYGIEGSDHCFVVTEDKKTSWRNNGGGWDDSRAKTLVAKNRAYKEWMMEFVPPDNIYKCGISFGKNGLCQTYANRELLIGEDRADARKSGKNYVCVFFFGKYGLGLKQMKQLLTESYNKVTDKYNDPYNALNKVLAKADDYLDDELAAWRQVAIEYGGIPIDQIMAKNPSGGLATARMRMRSFIDEREALYESCGQEWDFRGRLKELILRHCNDYLNMLANISYITKSERDTYSQSISRFLNRFNAAVALQVRALEETGSLCRVDMADLLSDGEVTE